MQAQSASRFDGFTLIAASVVGLLLLASILFSGGLFWPVAGGSAIGVALGLGLNWLLARSWIYLLAALVAVAVIGVVLTSLGLDHPVWFAIVVILVAVATYRWNR